MENLFLLFSVFFHEDQQISAWTWTHSNTHAILVHTHEQVKGIVALWSHYIFLKAFYDGIAAFQAASSWTKNPVGTVYASLKISILLNFKNQLNLSLFFDVLYLYTCYTI
jgi:hypothetical protein